MFISKAIKNATFLASISFSSFTHSATELPVDVTEFDIGGIKLGMYFDEALNVAAKSADVSKEVVKRHERIHPWFDRSLNGFTIQDETSILISQFVKHVPPLDESREEFVTYIELRVRGDTSTLSLFKESVLSKYGEPSVIRDDDYHFWCGSMAVTNDIRHCDKEHPRLTMQNWGEGVVKLYLVNYTPHNQLTEYEESLTVAGQDADDIDAHVSTLNPHDAYVGIFGAEFETVWPFQDRYSKHGHKKYDVPKTVLNIKKDGDAYLLYYLPADPETFIVLEKTDNGFRFNNSSMSLSEDKNTLYLDVNNTRAKRITKKEWGELEPHAIKESCSQHINIVAKEHGHTTLGQINNFYDEYFRNHRTETCNDNDMYYLDDIDCELSASESEFLGKKINRFCERKLK